MSISSTRNNHFDGFFVNFLIIMIVMFFSAVLSDAYNDVSKKLALITKGYAFAFQALGLLYFEYHDSLSLDDILSKLDDMLDDFVYKKPGLPYRSRIKNIKCI